VQNISQKRNTKTPSHMKRCRKRTASTEERKLVNENLKCPDECWGGGTDIMNKEDCARATGEAMRTHRGGKAGGN